MTVVAVWLDKGFAYIAADTRLSRGTTVTTNSGAKIFPIPIVSLMPDAQGMIRLPKTLTTYGFAFAGAMLPAAMTAITATSMLGSLISNDGSQSPPQFEAVASFVEKLAVRFMKEHFDASPVSESLFSAVLLGWCDYDKCYKLGHIDWSIRDDGSFVAGLSIKPEPLENELWAALGSGEVDVRDLAKIKRDDGSPWQLAPRMAIQDIIARDKPDIGGAISMGFCNSSGFQQFSYLLSPQLDCHDRRVFNGIDIDQLGNIDGYTVGGIGSC